MRQSPVRGRASADLTTCTKDLDLGLLKQPSDHFQFFDKSNTDSKSHSGKLHFLSRIKRFFDTRPDRKRIEAVARIAGIHDEIISWPLGYFTRIGELCHGLSAGQLQRVLLARALYHRPRLLLLDKAFSHLDAASEHAIIESLRSMGTSCVLVSHRATSLQRADRILELGPVQAPGTPS